ncbi:MAG: hypothetical protein RI883_1860 [Bacteroidota bacterium]|jgi:hypothetical protein
MKIIKFAWFYFLCITIHAQEWHSLAYPFATDQNYGVSIDMHHSKQYFTGVYKGQLSIGFNSLSGLSNDDIFFGKASLDGYTEWIQAINGTEIDRPNKIVALNDKLFVSGIFSDSLFIGNDTLKTIHQKAAFLATFDTLGNYITTFHPDAYNIEFEDFVIDEDGNMVITGEFYQFVNHGDFSMNVVTGLNFFLIKYNPSLDKIIWGVFASGSSSIGRKVDLDGNGNIYVTGSYNDQTNFVDTLLTANNMNHNLFVAKFDASGNIIWVRTAEGEDEVHGYGIASDESGNVFVVGEFEGTVSLQGNIMTSAGLYDILIAKFDTDGNLVWAHKAGGPESDEGYDVEIDANQDIIVLSDASIDVTYRGSNIDVSGFDEPLLMKIANTTGELIWSKRLYSTPTSGLVNGVDLTIEDTIIGMIGINRSDILFDGNLVQSANLKDFYTAILVDSLTYHLGFSKFEVEIVSVYPNPCSDYFRIHGNIENDLSVYDLSGKEIIHLKDYQSNYPISTSHLNSGVYLIKYKILGTTYSTKIIINH